MLVEAVCMSRCLITPLAMEVIRTPEINVVEEWYYTFGNIIYFCYVLKAILFLLCCFSLCSVFLQFFA